MSANSMEARDRWQMCEIRSLMNGLNGISNRDKEIESLTKAVKNLQLVNKEQWKVIGELKKEVKRLKKLVWGKP